MKVKIIHLIPLVAIAISGCASTKISDLNTYQKVPLQTLENMPSKAALLGAKSRVIILNLEDKKWPGAGEEVADKVAQQLNSTKNVQIVDRSLASSLGKEIELAEMKGRTGYKGQDVADFAITGKVIGGGAGIKFTAASTWKDDKGEYHTSPATCTTSGQVAFSLKIVQMPSLEVIKIIDQKANASSIQDATWGGCSPLTQGAANGIVSAAIGNAIQKAHTELKNQFAPSGYVIDHRKHDKDNIFKATLGSTSGAKEGLSVEFIRNVQDKNALTGQTTIEQVKIAEGIISDQIGSNFSFLIVKDAAKANKILLGEKVQVKFEDSFMDGLNKLAN